MRDTITWCIFFLMTTRSVVVAVIDPLSWGMAVGGAAGIYASYKYVECNLHECCTNGWIKPDLDGMQINLTNHLYGQHLVKNVVLKSVRAHIRKNEPSKPLVLSFHGWTGGGKTYVSKIIAHHLYYNGFNSKFVHFFMPTIHFPHANKVDEYKDNLVTWLKNNLSECQQSLFIFDEVDKMPEGLFDSIKPYLDYHQHVDGVNSRRSIFVLLSNSGGNDITSLSLQNWKAGKPREDMELKDFSQILSVDAFNYKGGLKRSSLIDSHLIDHYIPFLPLEKDHVKLCVRDELNRRGIALTKSLIDKVADELDYFPPELAVYSKQGCKRIEKLVDYFLEVDE